MFLYWGIRSWLSLTLCGLHPLCVLAPCRQGSRNLSLERSMPSCSLKAGNLIMEAVIYSSHGSYLAPAGLKAGEGGKGGRGNDWDSGRGRVAALAGRTNVETWNRLWNGKAIVHSVKPCVCVCVDLWEPSVQVTSQWASLCLFSLSSLWRFLWYEKC